MKKNLLYSFVFLVLTCCLNSNSLHAQATIEQNKMFPELLQEKRAINSTINFKNTYKIQVYIGDIETAKKTIASFKNEFDDLDYAIEFSAPNYKVWVGNFINKIDAERNLQKIQTHHPKAFIIKPVR